MLTAQSSEVSEETNDLIINQLVDAMASEKSRHCRSGTSTPKQVSLVSHGCIWSDDDGFLKH